MMPLYVQDLENCIASWLCKRIDGPFGRHCALRLINYGNRPAPTVQRATPSLQNGGDSKGGLHRGQRGSNLANAAAWGGCRPASIHKCLNAPVPIPRLPRKSPRGIGRVSHIEGV